MALDDSTGWKSELKQLLAGDAVLFRSHHQFKNYMRPFNTAIVSPAQAIVFPSSAQTIAHCVTFAASRRLTVSVKGGGFNTAGWAVAGDIIIDLGLLDRVEFHPSTEQLPSLRDRPTVDRGKKRSDEEAFASGSGTKEALNMTKRALKDDSPLASTSSSDRSQSRDLRNDGTPSVTTPSRESSGDLSTNAKGKRRETNDQAREETAAARRTSTAEWLSDQDQEQTADAALQFDGRTIPFRTFSGVPNEQSLYPAPSGDPPFATSFQSRFANLERSRLAIPGISMPFSTSGPATLSNQGFVFNTAALAPSSKLHLSNAAPAVPPAPPSMSTTSYSTSYPAANQDNNEPPSPSQSAMVTIGMGAKSKTIDQATSKFGYFVPLAAYPVGCAIFATGGFGFMSRLHGLTMDNVVEAEVVLPDGRIVYLSDSIDEQAQRENLSPDEVEELKDLWWAFRGAGVAMGIITRVRCHAFKVGPVYSGNLIYPFNPATTPSLMKHWRDVCKNAPRELYMNLILTAGPDARSHVVVIQICYLGERSVGETFMQAITSWEGETCLFKDAETRSFLTQQDSVVQILSAKPGSRWCVRADLVHSLSDTMIHQTVNMFKDIPERSAWLFEIAGGAVADLGDEKTCFPHSHRTAPFQIAAIHQWMDPSNDQRWVSAARQWIDTTISPNSPGGPYPCFLESQEGLRRVASTYGDNWDRLVQIKNRLDPNLLLRHSFWPDEDATSAGQVIISGVTISDDKTTTT